jgi:hypothetical protein
MRTADIAIAWHPFGRLHQFGNVDLEGASSNWGTGGSPTAPNQDCREDGKECSSANC